MCTKQSHFFYVEIMFIFSDLYAETIDWHAQGEESDNSNFIIQPQIVISVKNVYAYNHKQLSLEDTYQDRNFWHNFACFSLLKWYDLVSCMWGGFTLVYMHTEKKQFSESAQVNQCLREL